MRAPTEPIQDARLHAVRTLAQLLVRHAPRRHEAPPLTAAETAANVAPTDAKPDRTAA